jgi:hypothetical protein
MLNVWNLRHICKYDPSLIHACDPAIVLLR